jgi:hypothetical protein
MPEFQPLAPRTMTTDRVVSVCPLHLRKEMAIGNGFYTFEIAPQERGHYAILELHDTYTMIRAGFKEETDADEHYRPAPIYSDKLADSLSICWNNKIARQGGMGVAVVPRNMQEGSPEFKNLLRSLTAQVSLMADWFISVANSMHQQGQSAGITPTHKTFATWKLGDAASALPWFVLENHDSIKKCPGCSRGIQFQAIICDHCGTDLPAFYQKYNLDPSGDPSVSEFMKNTLNRMPAASTGTTATAASEPLPKATFKPQVLSPEIRTILRNKMDSEQTAEYNRKTTMELKDDYLVGVIPAMCLKSSDLKAKLKDKGCPDYLFGD